MIIKTTPPPPSQVILLTDYRDQLRLLKKSTLLSSKDFSFSHKHLTVLCAFLRLSAAKVWRGEASILLFLERVLWLRQLDSHLQDFLFPKLRQFAEQISA